MSCILSLNISTCLCSVAVRRTLQHLSGVSCSDLNQRANGQNLTAFRVGATALHALPMLKHIAAMHILG